MCTLRVSTVGTILTVLLIWLSIPAAPSSTPQPSPLTLFSQIIESNPKPPTEQGETKPLEPVEKNPGPYIEQNPTPPIEQNPTPPIEQNPTQPIEKQSMRRVIPSGVVDAHWLPGSSKLSAR